MNLLRRRFFRLSTYNILANVTVPLAGLVDTAMLGHLPDIRFLAGVALGVLVFDYVYWMFGFLRMGTTGTTAQAIGRGDGVEAHRILHRSLVVAALAATAILLLRGPLGDLSFALLSGEADVEAAGRAYFDARVWGAPAVLANFVFVGWFLGREESRLVLLMTMVANVANVVLDYLFIFRWGWAARGAGLATMSSQYLMLAVGVALYLRRREAVPWTWSAILERGSLVALVRLHVDILIRTFFLVTGFAVFINFSAILGTAVLAANSVLLRWLSLAAYFIDGAAFATESLIGVFHGRGDREGLRRLLRLALLTGVAFAVPFIAVLAFAPGALLGLLTSHADVVALATELRVWMLPTLFFGSIAYILDGVFLGLAAGPILRNASVAVFVVYLPLAAVALVQDSEHLLWMSFLVFTFARVVSLGWPARRLVQLDTSV